MPSYNFCAICIVLFGLNPNLLDASCCIDDVLNGGRGFLFCSLFSMLDTLKTFSFTMFSMCCVSCSFFMFNLSIFYF